MSPGAACVQLSLQGVVKSHLWSHTHIPTKECKGTPPRGKESDLGLLIPSLLLEIHREVPLEVVVNFQLCMMRAALGGVELWGPRAQESV